MVPKLGQVFLADGREIEFMFHAGQANETMSDTSG